MFEWILIRWETTPGAKFLQNESWCACCGAVPSVRVLPDNDYSAWLSAKEGCEFLALFTEVIVSSSLSKSSSKFLIQKIYLLTSVKLRNEQLTVNIVSEVIVLLVFSVLIKILVLCGTFEMWWVLCEVVLTLQGLHSQCHTCGSWVGGGWRRLCSYMVHNNPAHSSSGMQLVSQAGRMWKLGTSEPCSPWHRHCFWHSVREHAIVIMQKFELPEEQKGGRLQRKTSSAVCGRYHCLLCSGGAGLSARNWPLHAECGELKMFLPAARCWCSCQQVSAVMDTLLSWQMGPFTPGYLSHHRPGGVDTVNWEGSEQVHGRVGRLLLIK